MIESLRRKRWRIHRRTEGDLLKHLLRVRGVDDEMAFLAPDYSEHIHSPWLMKGMKPAVHRLVAALSEKEPIGVFADYDSDGTPGAALLIDGLRQLGAVVHVYIPTRSEGYGLSEDGLRALHEAGVRVVVTIDLGITGKEFVEKAKILGLDMIITDHHTVQDDLYPNNALAVLNPKQRDCSYPFKELCGAGIAWKLWAALVDYLAQHQRGLLQGREPESLIRWSLDLAAIGTLCDMVPLVGENRVIATYGLKVLQKTRRAGLLALYNVAGIIPKKLNEGTVGFQIGPRINAPTRLAAAAYGDVAELGPQASLALVLLTTKNTRLAGELAEKLQEYNLLRQSQLSQVLQEAEAIILDQKLYEHSAIIVAGEGWPVGVVGLVAGRVTERYGRPAFVLSLDGEEATGSARSVDAFPLVSALQDCREHLLKFGGHAKAAGLTLMRDKLVAFSEAMRSLADRDLSPEALTGELLIEAPLSPQELELATVQNLAQLSPYGIANPRPIFLLPRVSVTGIRRVGATNQHLKCLIQHADGLRGPSSVIGFGLGEMVETLSLSDTWDLAVQLSQSEWQGQQQLDIHLLDARPAE